MCKVILTLVLFFLEREWKLIFHAALVMGTFSSCRLIMYVHLKYFEGYKIFFPSLEPPSDQEKVGRRLGQAGYPLQQGAHAHTLYSVQHYRSN